VEQLKAEAVKQRKRDFLSECFIVFILNCIIGGVVIDTGGSTDARPAGSRQDSRNPLKV
jgi:hypothetical protein